MSEAGAREVRREDMSLEGGRDERRSLISLEGVRDARISLISLVGGRDERRSIMSLVGERWVRRSLMSLGGGRDERRSLISEAGGRWRSLMSLEVGVDAGGRGGHGMEAGILRSTVDGGTWDNGGGCGRVGPPCCMRQWILNQLDLLPYLDPDFDIPTMRHFLRRQALQAVLFFLSTTQR